MSASAAEVIYQLLVDLELAEVSDGWETYISFMPDEPNIAIGIYDAAGRPDGRVMTGEKIIHPGVQIRIRHPIYRTGAQRVRAIATALDNQIKTVVAVESDTSYILHNVSRQGDILSVGMDEQDKQRRHYWTINAVLTYAEIPIVALIGRSIGSGFVRTIGTGVFRKIA